jgi:hypothetical protein
MMQMAGTLAPARLSAALPTIPRSLKDADSCRRPGNLHVCSLHLALSKW